MRVAARFPVISSRPTVTDLETQALQLQEERRKREELEAQVQTIRAEQAAWEQEFYAYMRSQFAAMGHTVAPMPPWAPPPPAISPMSALTTFYMQL
ncbi:hypothetical protein ACP70R_043395 [Stipagrostis hirtigluma subsp. patula]